MLLVQLVQVLVMVIKGRRVKQELTEQMARKVKRVRQVLQVPKEILVLQEILVLLVLKVLLVHQVVMVMMAQMEAKVRRVKLA